MLKTELFDIAYTVHSDTSPPSCASDSLATYWSSRNEIWFIVDSLIGCFFPWFRWTQELDDLKEQRTRLLGDCLLGSAFMCYVGAFSWEFRHEMVYSMWWKDLVKRGIPISKPFRLETLLTNDIEISKYDNTVTTQPTKSKGKGMALI